MKVGSCQRRDAKKRKKNISEEKNEENEKIQKGAAKAGSQKKSWKLKFAGVVLLSSKLFED